MKIYGYSERGAMNALFYGMAHDETNGDNALLKFINDLAKIDGTFTNFELYNEFSLSEFGDPDMMIIAKDENGKKVVFFIEAKASCCESYNLETQRNHHERFVNYGEFQNGHASNLFFQLRLKNYFFQLLPDFYRDTIINNQDNLTINNDPKLELKQSRGRNRKIGENVVVRRMVNKLSECKNAYYIAIIPEQDSEVSLNTKDDYGFETYTITWEELYSNVIFRKYIKDTIDFNGSESETPVNQILNNQRRKQRKK